MKNMKPKYLREFLNALKKGHFFWEKNMVIFPRQHAAARGLYWYGVDGEPWRYSHNLLPDEGLTHMLAVSLGSVTPQTAWYLALYGNNIAPASNWTAASFTSTANEITSTSEGYTATRRPLWSPTSAASRKINNVGNEAVYTIACTTPLDLYGAALISDSARGGTGGVLTSATLFRPKYTVQDGNTFRLGYEVELQDI